MTPEKELILAKFNTLMYMDNNIASIVDNYIYQNVVDLSGSYFRKFTGRYGKFHGEYIEYFKEDFPNKIQCTSHWKNGVLDGDYKKWYVNNVLEIQTTYKDGKIHGEYKEFWSNKRPAIECIYNEGECKYCKSWDRMGNILHE